MIVKARGIGKRALPLTGKGYMGISLHSRNHTGLSFASIVDWLNKNTTFEEIRIGLSDTLNRHNYMSDGLSEQQAIKKSLDKGNEWLEENNASIQRLDVPYHIIRWSHWLEHRPATIFKNIQKYQKAYKDISEFKQAIDKDIESFQTRGSAMDRTFDSQASYRYLIEELAVYEEIFENYGCDVFYPGKQLACFDVIRSGIVPIAPNIQKTNYVRLNLVYPEEKALPEENKKVA